MSELRRRAGELARWAGALPVAVHLPVAAVALVGVLWLMGALGLAWSHFKDRAVDAKVAELQQKAAVLTEENARLQVETDVLKARMAEKDELLKALAERAREEDATLDDSKKRHADARAGRGARPVRDRDNLDERLRSLYPEAPE